MTKLLERLEFLHAKEGVNYKKVNVEVITSIVMGKTATKHVIV